MMYDYTFPREVFYGKDSYKKLNDICGKYRRILLVIGGKSAKNSGAYEKVLSQIMHSDSKVTVISGVSSDPTDDFVNDAVNRARKEGIECVVALGGGSVLDVGKSVAALITNPGKVEEYQETTGKPRSFTNEPVPFVAIPTTAGSGSEATRNAVITNTKLKLKRSIRDPKLVPRYAILEPEFTYTLPPYLTAWTGMDALVQCIEPYVGKKAHKLNDLIAEQGIKLIYENLPIAYKQPEDYTARLNMQLGAFLSGLALANASLGVVHALAHPIGVHYGVHHGLACAVILPYSVELNWKCNVGKYANIARLFGVSDRKSDSYLAKLLVDMLFQFNRMLNIPASFAEFGLRQEDFAKIIADCKTGSLRNNPCHLTDEYLYALLERLV